MDKRGISHVEIILAFVIFVAVVGFALYFFNPGDSTRLVETSLEYAFREISQNTSIPIETFSVVIDSAAIVGDNISLNFSGIDGNVRVEEYNGTVLNSSHVGDLVHVQAADWSAIELIFVMFGEEFYETPSLIENHNETYYEIGSSNMKDVLSEERFRSLVDAYDHDYFALKGEDHFNLADRANFGFSLEFDDGSSIDAQKDILSGLDVFVEAQRIEVLREDGDIVFSDLVVKVW